jgi:hypothetical protein
MKVEIEQFGSQIGVNNNITDAFKQKKLHLLLTVKDDHNKMKSEYILTGSEALDLANRINDLLNDELTQELGFTYS